MLLSSSSSPPLSPHADDISPSLDAAPRHVLSESGERAEARPHSEAAFFAHDISKKVRSVQAVSPIHLITSIVAGARGEASEHVLQGVVCHACDEVHGEWS